MGKLNKRRRAKRTNEKRRAEREAAGVTCPECVGQKTKPFELGDIRRGGYPRQINSFGDMVIDCSRCRGKGKLWPGER